MSVLSLLKSEYIGENAQEINLHDRELQRDPPVLTTKEIYMLITSNNA